MVLSVDELASDAGSASVVEADGISDGALSDDGSQNRISDEL